MLGEVKVLVVYYSRSGNTRCAAKEIARRLGADIEEIKDKSNRDGFFGFIRSGYHAVRGVQADIKDTKLNPADYDIVIIGSPVWAGKVSCPVRTYLHKYKDRIKSLALFITRGSSKNIYTNVIKEMENMAQHSAEASATLAQRQIKNNDFTYIEPFIHKLKHL